MVSRPQVRLRLAAAADHFAVEDLLATAGPNARQAFAASLEHPSYDPGQRLLVHSAGQLLAHAHLLPRSMQIGATRVPIGLLMQLVALPEPLGQSCDVALARAAARLMVERRLPLAMLATRDPARHEPFGWTVCRPSAPLQTSTRGLLSQLSMRGLRADESRVSIRPWRQVELPALIALHARIADARAGSIVREEQDWRWLIAGGSYERIYVALDDDAPLDADAREPHVAAYAVVRDDRVLELIESPDGPPLAEHLLARIASEAVERDGHALRVHSPHAGRLRELFADGAPVAPGRQLAVRMNDPVLLLRHLERELTARAATAGLALPCELGLDLPQLKLIVRLSRRGLQLQAGKLGRSYLRGDQPTMTRLLLGMLDVRQAITSGKLLCSTRLAAETAQVLFPSLDFWSSPWDNADFCA